nr:phosphoribosylaminoimidazolesuccinocarboxamide synthase [Granulosicoccus sp.]
MILHTELSALEKLYSGKVRDVYAVDDDHLLIIATDRISAYDVILPGGIPDKGKLLTRMALFWFDMMSDLV